MYTQINLFFPVPRTSTILPHNASEFDYVVQPHKMTIGYEKLFRDLFRNSELWSIICFNEATSFPPCRSKFVMSIHFDFHLPRVSPRPEAHERFRRGYPINNLQI